MKKTIIFSLISSLYLFTLTSCIKDVDNIDLPSEDPKLTVASFISPSDSIHSVFVTWSKPIFGNNSNNNWGAVYEENATVTINDGSQDYNFIWDPNQQAYISFNSALQYQQGQEYTLTVSKDDTKVTASCMIPNAPNYTLEHLNSVVTSNDSWSKEYLHNFLYTIKDNGDDNYYRVMLGTKKTYFQDSYVEIHAERFVKGSYGDEFKIAAYFYGYDDNPGGLNLDTIAVNVMRCSREYYLYHQSAMNYTGDNPFAEPTIVFSNVENGLGVFCGYQMKEEERILPVPN